MSTDASREAFEAWWKDYADEDSDKVSAQDARHASRKQALGDAVSLCHDAATGDPTLTARFCAHALKALK